MSEAGGHRRHVALRRPRLRPIRWTLNVKMVFRRGVHSFKLLHHLGSKPAPNAYSPFGVRSECDPSTVVQPSTRGSGKCQHRCNMAPRCREKGTRAAKMAALRRRSRDGRACGRLRLRPEASRCRARHAAEGGAAKRQRSRRSPVVGLCRNASRGPVAPTRARAPAADCGAGGPGDLPTTRDFAWVRSGVVLPERHASRILAGHGVLVGRREHLVAVVAGCRAGAPSEEAASSSAGAGPAGPEVKGALDVPKPPKPLDPAQFQREVSQAPGEGGVVVLRVTNPRPLRR